MLNAVCGTRAWTYFRMGIIQSSTPVIFLSFLSYHYKLRSKNTLNIGILKELDFIGSAQYKEACSDANYHITHIL